MVASTDRETYLQTGLVQALRKERYGRLCRHEPSDTTHISTLLSQGMTWSMVASLAFWLFVRVNLSVWQSIGVVVVFLFVLALFAGATKRFGLAALVIVVLWIATGVYSYVTAGIGGAALTNLLPFALVALSVWTWRALALASSIPFLLPVALVVVFLPLLTQDLWVVGDEIGTQLVAVAFVALAPPLGFLAYRYSRIDVSDQFSSALGRVRQSEALQGKVLEAIRNAPREVAADPPSDEWLWAKLKGQYESVTDSEARQLGVELSTLFRRQTIFRLMRLAIGIGALFGAFVYVLAWAAIPISTSARWIGHDVATSSIDFAGWSFTLPTSQYLAVAVLLSIVAAAAFVAFALTEDRYSNALTDVLVGDPAERCVMLAVPYRSLYPSK